MPENNQVGAYWPAQREQSTQADEPDNYPGGVPVPVGNWRSADAQRPTLPIRPPHALAYCFFARKSALWFEMPG